MPTPSNSMVVAIPLPTSSGQQIPTSITLSQQTPLSIVRDSRKGKFIIDKPTTEVKRVALYRGMSPKKVGPLYG